MYILGNYLDQTFNDYVLSKIPRNSIKKLLKDYRVIFKYNIITKSILCAYGNSMMKYNYLVCAESML